MPSRPFAERLATYWRLIAGIALGMGALTSLAIASPATVYPEPNGTVDIRFQPASATPLVQPWMLLISGTWPNACLPHLTGLQVQDMEIRIEARSNKSLCAALPTPLEMHVDPAASMGQVLLPPGVYRVGFYAANGTQAPLSLRGFALLDTSSPNTAALEPESGFWWPAADNTESNAGTGLSLERQGSTLILSTMGYNEAGNPEWYFGSGTLTGRSAHVPLLRMHGGGSLFASDTRFSPEAEAAITLDLEFQSNAHAIAWFSRINEGAAIEQRAIPLVRVAFGNEPSGKVWQGEWVLVPDSPGANPRRLRLDRLLTADQGNFRLSDDTDGSVLNCHGAIQHTQTPPQSCTLEDANGNPIAKFSTVAIMRLDGVGTDGYPARLIRISQPVTGVEPSYGH